jgi:hypothetical protein
MPDSDAVWDHFASAIAAYRLAADAGKWTPVAIDARHLSEHSVFATVHGMRSTRMGRWSETPGRATNCSPLRTGGASSRTPVTSELCMEAARIEPAQDFVQ